MKKDINRHYFGNTWNHNDLFMSFFWSETKRLNKNNNNKNPNQILKNSINMQVHFVPNNFYKISYFKTKKWCILKINPAEKRTLSPLWNMEDALLCFGAALLHLAKGVLNLCRLQWNLKTILRERCSAQWAKILPQLQVMGLETGSWVQIHSLKTPKTGSEQTIGQFSSGLLWALI